MQILYYKIHMFEIIERKQVRCFITKTRKHSESVGLNLCQVWLCMQRLPRLGFHASMLLFPLQFMPSTLARFPSQNQIDYFLFHGQLILQKISRNLYMTFFSYPANKLTSIKRKLKFDLIWFDPKLNKTSFIIFTKLNVSSIKSFKIH